jgi:hemerythrin-like domain-containing protein
MAIMEKTPVTIEPYKSHRRDFIIAATAAIPAFLSTALPTQGFGVGCPLEAGEDLMEEHGVLGRLLLIYDALSIKLRNAHSEQERNLAKSCLSESTQLIINNIQGNHERIEELVIFPALRKANMHNDLVAILVLQHHTGQELINTIAKKLHSGAAKTEAGRNELADLTHSFSTMYRPHALREDTVIFPTLHRIMSPDAYQQLSESVRTLETKMVHNPTLEDILKQVDQLETALSIHDLAQFTAKLANT